MSPKPLYCQVDRKGYKVEALCYKMGNDYLLSIWGGVAHIGAVAMAQPRASLRDGSKRSATASVFCYVGHKEDDLVKEVSERFARELNARVVVAAGLHWDNLTPDGIATVLNNTKYLVADLIEKVKLSSADQ